MSEDLLGSQYGGGRWVSEVGSYLSNPGRQRFGLIYTSSLLWLHKFRTPGGAGHVGSCVNLTQQNRENCSACA